MKNKKTIRLVAFAGLVGAILAIIVAVANNNGGPKKGPQQTLGDVERAVVFFQKAQAQTIAKGQRVKIPKGTQVLFLGHTTKKSDDRLSDGTPAGLPRAVPMRFRLPNGQVIDEATWAYWRHVEHVKGIPLMWQAWQAGQLTVEIHPSASEEYANLFFSPEPF